MYVCIYIYTRFICLYSSTPPKTTLLLDARRIARNLIFKGQKEGSVFGVGFSVWNSKLQNQSHQNSLKAPNLGTRKGTL